MSKSISMTLNSESIDNAIKEATEYRNSIQLKLERLVESLNSLGASQLKLILSKNTYSGQTIGSVRVKTNKAGSIVLASVIVESSAILFLEFGAGIKHNQSEVHPLASALGYGVGTYPGQTHANDPDGWWYMGDDGQWHHSYGIKASMPVLKASIEMRNNILNISKKIFS